MSNKNPLKERNRPTNAVVLAVENQPRIQPGDTLLIFPSVGKPYKAHVVETQKEDRIKVRLPGALYPSTRVFRKDELEEWYAEGDLLINPEPENGGVD